MDRTVRTGSAPDEGRLRERGSHPPLRRVLARRLILHLVLFSSLITLITTTVQLYADFRRDVDALDFQFAQIEASYLQPLIQDLWVLDDEQVMVLLSGMLALPDIARLEIRHAGHVLHGVGERPTGATQTRSFPLVHGDGRDHALGTLHVEASLAGIHQRLLARVWLILASNALKTFAVVLFVYVLFRGLITRHLEHIARHLAGIDPGSPGDTLSLARPLRASRDELDVVVDAINRLQATLRASYASLSESESRLRAVFDNSPSCIALKSVDDRFVLLSRQCEELLGGPLEASLGRRARDVLATSPITELDREAANEGSLRPPGREYAVRGAAGYRVYLANEFPVMGEKGDLTGVGMIATDITRRKQAEDELRRHRNRLEEMVAERTAALRRQAEILGQIHDAVISTNLEGRIQSWNAGAERQFGYLAEEALGKPLAILCPGDVRTAPMEEVLARLRRRGEHETELRLRRKSGETIFAHLSMTLLRDEAREPVGMAAYAIDISARKRAEAGLVRRTAELEAVNRELESFSYTVSHDLRAPLRAIDGFTSILLEEHGPRLDATARDYLERTCAASQHMARLIDDLLALSLIARADIHRVPMDLSAVAREILERLQATEPRREVQVTVEADLKADADPGLTRAILENLLCNAWKFTRDRQPARIGFGVRDGDAGRAFFVRDNGIGFDMRHATRMFSPFQRLHGAEAFEGTGIGLATVARIVHRHGGRVWAEARPGEGATFHFTLQGEHGDARP